MATESHSPQSSDVWDEGMATPVMTINKMKMRERDTKEYKEQEDKERERARYGERKMRRKER